MSDFNEGLEVVEVIDGVRYYKVTDALEAAKRKLAENPDSEDAKDTLALMERIQAGIDAGFLG